MAASWPINLKKDLSLRQSFDLLRRKWGEVPYTQYDRISSTNLLSLPDQEILQVWNNAYMTTSTGPGFSVRGWYQLLYKDSFRGKKILDFGCGLAPDNVFFAEQGANVTFLDIVETNVEFVKRVYKIKN